MTTYYKIMSQNGDRKTPKCEKTFRSWFRADVEMRGHAKSFVSFRKKVLTKNEIEIEDTNHELTFHSKPKLLQRVEFLAQGCGKHRFRYWVEIVQR